MSSFVVATAGHVDHGKSALVRALTGIEPDRWDEEKRRGLTIDLGFAWTTLPSGREVSFVDVPGHERFLGNMLAGLGPAPIVCFVVAADEGWMPQSSDHRDALAALGIERGLILVTRADLAPDRVPAVIAQARRALAGTGLASAPALGVSALTGAGLDELRTALDAVLAEAPQGSPEDRVRLWIDRAFTIGGAGTVVTGTLTAGSVAAGDRLALCGRDLSGTVDVRGVHSRSTPIERAEPTARVAVNLRGAQAGSVHRGDALLTPDAWWETDVVDVRGTSTGSGAGTGPGTVDLTGLAEHLTVHLGTAAVRARLRPFDARHGRLHLEHALPLAVGDRAVLRNPGSEAPLAGAELLDVDPPQLGRRGAGARRASALARMTADGDLLTEVRRRDAMADAHVRRLGITVPDPLPSEVREVGDLFVADEALARWAAELGRAVAADSARDPLSAGLPLGAAQDLLALPDPRLLAVVADRAGLTRDVGRLRAPGQADGLGPAEAGIAALERRLRRDPFAAPEADDLTGWRLGARELAAAARLGRVLRLPDGVVLLPDAPARAMRVLAGLDQPFTASTARQALGTTRRVAIPLLEHLDSRGWTRRVDSGRREVVR
ncbi:SelB C-terminal domain-containing protein [Brevibacterium sp. CS2]|uniref:selenocysteine-specific translation elongation factor n=1 Tax=Brevibacterium sp. CS2 TaxID=2575923 RepID=UPI0010C7AD5F|nr:SelB C-terminal domain-containing protein [Brevibacterium sp. CS2]QCP06101.1 selenocysteine-specific translation elongation factor [Brevibacterium sp. CS2]